MTLAPLATIDDFAVRLAVPLTDDKIDRALALLVDASASVRGYTGQEFTEGTSITLLRPKDRIVRLPQRPVTAVTSVVDSNANPVAFAWEGAGVDKITVPANTIDSWAWEPWLNGLTSVLVTYDHGYEEIPADIVAIVCQIAARAAGRDPTEGGIFQESIAGYSYQVGSTGAAGAFGMLADERAVLDRYAAPQIGSISVGLR